MPALSRSKAGSGWVAAHIEQAPVTINNLVVRVILRLAVWQLRWTAFGGGVMINHADDHEPHQVFDIWRLASSSGGRWVW
jgi:hypothetical protein